jgi:hypothetical protein
MFYSRGLIKSFKICSGISSAFPFHCTPNNRLRYKEKDLRQEHRKKQRKIRRNEKKKDKVR